MNCQLSTPSSIKYQMLGISTGKPFVYGVAITRCNRLQKLLCGRGTANDLDEMGLFLVYTTLLEMIKEPATTLTLETSHYLPVALSKTYGDDIHQLSKGLRKVLNHFGLGVSQVKREETEAANAVANHWKQQFRMETVPRQIRLFKEDLPQEIWEKINNGNL